jgi:hypothetical protein
LTRKPLERATIEFDEEFDRDFPGFQTLILDLVYDFRISEAITSKPALDKPSHEDIPVLLYMHTRKQRDLIQRGISIKELTDRQDPESFRALEAMSTAEGFLDPPPSEAHDEPIRVDPTDVPERMEEEVEAIEPVPVRSLTPSPVAGPSNVTTKRIGSTNLDIQRSAGAQEIPWIPAFKITTPKKRSEPEQTLEPFPPGPPKTAKVVTPGADQQPDGSDSERLLSGLYHIHSNQVCIDINVTISE